MNAIPQIQTYTCPCCGGFIGEAAPIDQVLESTKGGYAKTILETLAKRPGKIVSRARMIDVMYGHLPNGGPDSAAAAVNVHIYRLRKTIAPFGWTVLCVGRDQQGTGEGGAYRLIPTTRGA